MDRICHGTFNSPNANITTVPNYLYSSTVQNVDQVTPNNLFVETTQQQNTEESLILNFVNNVHADKREASVIVSNENVVSKSSNLYDAMIQTEVRQRGIFKKMDKSKDFSINLIIQYDDCEPKTIKYTAASTRTITINLLLAIPNVQYKHKGIIELEVKEVEKITNYDDDDL